LTVFVTQASRRFVLAVWQQVVEGERNPLSNFASFTFSSYREAHEESKSFFVYWSPAEKIEERLWKHRIQYPAFSPM